MFSAGLVHNSFIPINAVHILYDRYSKFFSADNNFITLSLGSITAVFLFEILELLNFKTR